jgi:hypothetical protein
MKTMDTTREVRDSSAEMASKAITLEVLKNPPVVLH